MGKLQTAALAIIKRYQKITNFYSYWTCKYTHGWKQNERPTVCKEIPNPIIALQGKTTSILSEHGDS